VTDPTPIPSRYWTATIRAELAARRAAECGHGANCVTCSETKENEK
jgi:hypothetical protein